MIVVKKKLSVLLVIIWMVFIFIMSSFDANESSNQSGLIVGIISDIFNINNIHMLSMIIRKLAHFSEYFILGILTYNMIRKYDKKYYIAIIICVIYAISDEIHQIYVPGRSCQILDMAIDSLGALSSIFLFKGKHLFNK